RVETLANAEGDVFSRRLAMRLKVRREDAEAHRVKEPRAAEHARAIRADAVQQQHRAHTTLAAREPGAKLRPRAAGKRDALRVQINRRPANVRAARVGEHTAARQPEGSEAIPSDRAPHALGKVHGACHTIKTPSRSGDGHDLAHPRMDATLIAVNADL